MKLIQRLIQLVSPAVCAGAILLMAASAPAQNLFVGDDYLHAILEFTPAGVQSTFASGLGFPAGVVFDSAGNLFVGDSGTIFKFTPDGSRSVFASGLGESRGLAFNSAGNLFEADSSGKINEFTPQGVESVFASGLSTPWGLAFDRTNNLFVACESGNEIVKITPGGVPSAFASGLAGPVGLAFDTNGNLFVTTFAGGASPEMLLNISPGGVITTNIPGGLNYPFGVAVDSSNNVFVAGDGDGTILKVGMGIFASGLNSGGPWGLAFQPSIRPYIGLHTAANNGGFQLTATMSSPSSNIIVQASTDLVSWTNVYTNMPPFTFTDSLAAPWRFYRGLLDTN